MQSVCRIPRIGAKKETIIGFLALASIGVMAAILYGSSTDICGTSILHGVVWLIGCLSKMAPVLAIAFAVKILFERLRDDWKKTIVNCIPLPIRSLAGCDAMPLLRESARIIKPFVLTTFFLSSAPISVLIIFCHYIGKLFGIQDRWIAPEPPGRLTINQNKNTRWNCKIDSFYMSPMFAVTLLLCIGLGFPMAMLFGLNHFLSVDSFLSTLPIGTISEVAGNAGNLPLIDQSMPLHRGNAGFAQFELYAYLFSVSSCMMVLFFRAWLLFPSNFFDTEYSIVFDEKGIQKNAIKGWLMNVLWWGFHSYMPRFMAWSEVAQVRYELGGCGRFGSLPEIFPKDGIIFRTLEKYGSYLDAIGDKVGRSEYIFFRTEYELFGGGIQIALADLNPAERARLFYAIRKWLPSLYIEPQVQEKLLGSTVMKEPRFTEIWFDLLTSKDRQSPDLLQPGDFVRNGKYQVDKQIGFGGQSVVYLARNESGIKVVLKEYFLSPGDVSGALLESSSDFENESRILSELSHPSVIKMLDMFAEKKRVYLVLEHVDAPTLREFIATNGPLGERQTLELSLALCDVLQHLHSQTPQVVHRDFTPENIIIAPDNSIKLIDFSVASHPNSVKSGNCVGKHAYTPPEQFRSETTPQSDIYALGATMYFLITGRDPKPISKSVLRNEEVDVSHDLSRIIERATELNLNERYESISWLHLDLEALLKKLPGQNHDSADVRFQAVEETDTISITISETISLTTKSIYEESVV